MRPILCSDRPGWAAVQCPTVAWGAVDAFEGIGVGPAEEPSYGRRELLRPVGGRLIRTVEQGPVGAPVAFMLHGLPGSAEDWDRLGEALASTFHVVAIDRPGYGGSGPSTLSVPAQVDLYAELLVSLPRGPLPALVLGHSYGAVPAAELAARHGSLVGGLVLLAPALREERADREPPPGAEAIMRMLDRPRVAAFLQATILGEVGRAMIARVAGPMSFEPDPVDEEHLRGVRDRTLQLGSVRSFAAEATKLVAEAEVVDRMLGSLVVPTLVVHARGDRVVDPSAGRRTAHSIPDARLEIIDGGHMLTISRAHEVAPMVLELATAAGLVAESPA